MPEVQIPVTPFVIQILASFPYGSTKFVPWRYEPKAYKNGQERQSMVITEPNITSIFGYGWMTHSGQVFTPRTVEPLAKAKGKEVATNTPNPTYNIEYQEGSSSSKDVSS